MEGVLNRTVALRAVSAGLAGAAIYSMRRRAIARWLDLPTPDYQVRVVHGIRIVMRDGVELAADHYQPAEVGTFPTIVMRTPYGRGWRSIPLGLKEDFIAQRLAERGYHVILQDVRGRFESEGEFNPFFNEAADGTDTLEWVARQPWFNGALGMWGQSYGGYVQWAAAAEAPSYLKALVPIVTGSRMDFFHTGPFALHTMLHWLMGLEVMHSRKKLSTRERLRRMDGRYLEKLLAESFQTLPLSEADLVIRGEPIRFYREWMAHAHSNDPHWDQLDHSINVGRVTAPTHLISGWYDLLLHELLRDYATMRTAGRNPYLTIGPWVHSDLDCVGTSLREGLFWFEKQLKGRGECVRKRPVRVYVLGAEEWREMEAWPPQGAERRLYLRAASGLAAEEAEEVEGPDHYRYDPTKPTPQVGGPLLGRDAGARDNRAIEARSDVLTFTTPPLENWVEVMGLVRAELYVSSTLDHSDFYCRLCDVYPDGRSMNICDGLMRVEPGKVDPGRDGCLKLEISMSSTALRFLQGHRIRLQVSSGAHPRLSRNHGTGEPLGTALEMRPADQTVYHDAEHPSALILPVTAWG